MDCVQDFQIQIYLHTYEYEYRSIIWATSVLKKGVDFNINVDSE